MGELEDLMDTIRFKHYLRGVLPGWDIIPPPPTGRLKFPVDMEKPAKTLCHAYGKPKCEGGFPCGYKMHCRYYEHITADCRQCAERDKGQGI